jgi:O-antigen/teichoic acid export membrane protein
VLGVAEYASLALAEAVLFLFLVVAGAGLNISLISELSSQTLDKQKVKATALLLASVTGAVVAGASYLAFFAMEIRAPAAFPYALTPHISMLCITETLSVICLTMLRAESNARKYAFWSVSQTIIAAATTAMLVIYFEMGVVAALIGRTISTLAVFVGIAVPFLLGSSRFFDKAIARNLIRIGFPVVPATLSATWLSYSPRIILAAFVPADVLGTFAFTTRIAGMLSLLMVQPLSLIWHPVMFSQGRVPATFNTFFSRTLTSYTILCAFTVGAAISAVFFIAWIMNKVALPFSETVFVLSALAVSYQGLLILLNVGPYLAKKTHAVLPAYLAAAVVSLLFLTILSYGFGANGAAAGSLISACVLCALIWQTSQRLYPLKVDTSALTTLVLVTAAAVAASFAMQLMFGRSLVISTISFGVFVVCFVGGLAATGLSSFVRPQSMTPVTGSNAKEAR